MTPTPPAWARSEFTGAIANRAGAIADRAGVIFNWAGSSSTGPAHLQLGRLIVDQAGVIANRGRRAPVSWRRDDGSLAFMIETDAGVLTEIDHVAIVVRDLDTAIDWYRATFGATVAHREVVARDGVAEALVAVADSYVQLLTPTREDSPVAKFLATRGEGLHHVAYRVADCAAALDAAMAAGARAIDATPRPGSRGTTVAFLHPSTSFGTLIELVEEAPNAQKEP